MCLRQRNLYLKNSRYLLSVPFGYAKAVFQLKVVLSFRPRFNSSVCLWSFMYARKKNDPQLLGSLEWIQSSVELRQITLSAMR